MKQFVFVLLLFGLLFGISSCASIVKEQERSTFYSIFSRGEIAGRHEQRLLLEPRNLSGTEAGPAAPPYQKHEEMTVQIDRANIPDFMEAVKQDVGRLKSACLESWLRR